MKDMIGTDEQQSFAKVILVEPTASTNSRSGVADEKQFASFFDTGSHLNAPKISNDQRRQTSEDTVLGLRQ